MVEFLYHALGICGEHNHPNLINLGFLAAGIYAITKILYNHGILASKSKN
jgi:hypothetical protein